jgi:serine protease DegQ
MALTQMKLQFMRVGVALLLAGMAAASAQDRAVGPMPSLAPLVEKVAPAVVDISVTGTRSLSSSNDPLFQFFGVEPPAEQLRGEGSGVIVDAENGYLITNNHVIEDANEITVTLPDGRSFPGTVVGSDAHSDLAVVKIDATGLTQIPFADSDDLKVGDYVVAIGNPLGLQNTVTAGIVSALGRQGLNRDPQADAYEDFIQTDASINVGNSGGALVNLNGELVGINSAIISQTGGNIGIGLAIPSRMAMSVMDQILEYGEVRRGFLGISMNDLTPDVAKDQGISVSSGALVTRVTEGSGAEQAGIQINDVIVGLNGEPVPNGNELRNRIGLMRPGDEVKIDLLRGERRMTVTATLGLRTEEVLASEQPGAAPPNSLFDGVEVTETQRGGLRGLAVVSVAPGSLAANQGLLEGDLIVYINRQPVTTLDEARQIVDSARSIFVQVRRGNRDLLLRLR